MWHKKISLPRLLTRKIEKGSPTSVTDGANNAADFISLFLDDAMLSSICTHTNYKMAQLAKNFKADIFTLKTVDLIELKALFGILIMAGVRNDNHLSSGDMWSRLEAVTLYYSTMNERRFAFLLQCIRFEDAKAKPDRLKEDRLAAVRSLWDSLVCHCSHNYTPGPHLTVDKQLLPFYGSCPFRMSIRSKPGR